MRITTQSQISIKPQLAELLSNLEVGDTVKGKLIEMLGQSISIKTASGQIFTAALMKAADINPGQAVELSITSITDEGIFAELKTDNQKPQVSDDAKMQQLLKQMDIKPEESNLQAAKLLVKYNMPVTKENISSLVNTQKSMESLAQVDAPKAVALLQSELNINNTEITKLVKQTAVLEQQSQQILEALRSSVETVADDSKPLQQADVKKFEQIPDNLPKQVEMQIQKPLENNPKAVMQQLADKVAGESELSKQEMPKLTKLIDTIAKVFETVSNTKPEQTAYMLSKDIKITPAAIKAMVDNNTGENRLSTQLESLENLVKTLEDNKVEVKEIKQELKKLFLKPEALLDKEQVSENLKDIIKVSSKLEAMLKENNLDRKVDTSVLQDIRNNLDFTRNINSNINYLQIPIQVNEDKTTAEIYVFNGKKRSKSVSSQNATILIALDLQQLGHIESLIAVNKKQVDITFKVEKEEFKKTISSVSNTLKEALEARGYSLNPLKVIDIKEKFNLLELEELTSVEAGQLHLDIRV
jgi:hypothetical protein